MSKDQNTGHKHFDSADVTAAAQRVLGTPDVVKTDMVDAPLLEDEQFDKAKALAQFVHTAQFEHEFTYGAGIETIALILSVELLGLHARSLSIEHRQKVWHTILAKALMHAQTLVEAYDKGQLVPTQIRGEQTFSNGQKGLI